MAERFGALVLTIVLAISCSSDAGRSADRVVDIGSHSLRALLAGLKIPPPYVLVGHSLGGLDAQVYAGLHPEEVAGMVLLDPPPLRFIRGEEYAELASMAERMTEEWQTAADSGLRSENREERANAGFLQMLASEHREMFGRSAEQASSIESFGDIPLVVVASGVPNPMFGEVAEAYQHFWARESEALAAKSSRGRFVFAESSTHRLHEDAADLVVEAILSITRAQGNGSVIDRALSHPDFTWRSVASDGVRLYYQPGSFAERHRVVLLRSARAALAQGLAFLEMEADERELRVVYLDNRGQMEKLIGRTYSGFADWTGRGVLLVCNPEWRSFDTHEIAHILSIGRWGDPDDRSRWMIEGLPIAVDGWCQTADVDRIAAYLAGEGRWPGLSAFTAGASSLGEIPGGVFGASLLRHLRERYGAAVIEDAWRSGLEAALNVRGVEGSQLEAEWLETLRETADPLTDVEWEKLNAGGCG